MSVLLAIFSATTLALTLRMAIPYVCAGLAGVWSERSGVVNIALEGILLMGGLAAVVGDHATGSPLAGLACGAAAGALVGFVHAALCVWGRIDAIVSGIAINLGVAGLARFVLRALYDSSSNSPVVEGLNPAATGDHATGALLVLRTLVDPLVLMTAALVGLTWFVLYKTRFGLRVRATGEDPSAAASAGVSVDVLRVAAVSLGGAIAGLGGVALAYDQHQFQAGMSSGRGFIALTAVILSGWRPFRAALACTAFAALDALQIRLQGVIEVSPYAIQMVPYEAAIVVLFVMALRGEGVAGRAPAGLGKHADQ